MEEKGLIEVTNELEAEIETVDLMKCFEEKELKRWDIGVKELTFLIPAMLKHKINDLRGRVLKIKK